MPPAILKNDFSGGLVTSRDRADLKPGEMQNATGITYRRGDRRAWQLKGRTVFGEVVADSAVNGLKLCQFDDSDNDLLVALTGSALYSAPTPGATGTFAADVAGRSAQAEKLHGVHLDNKWFLTTGQDSNTVFESDGSNRSQGMIAPQEKPAVAETALAGNSAAPGAASSSGFTNIANSYDADTSTYAHALLQAAGSATATWTTWGADAVGTRRMEILFRVAGAQIDTGGGSDIVTDAGFEVIVKFEVSEDEGDNWTTIYETTLQTFTSNIRVPSSITADNDKVHCKVTFTYSGGTSPATLRVYEVAIGKGSRVDPFDASPGMYYALAEADETRGIQGPPSEASDLVVMDGTVSNHDHVVITFPVSGAENSNATHWVIYRTPNGGSVPKQLGEIARVPIAETSFVDDFVDFVHTEQPLPIVPLKIIRRSDTELAVPRDSKPPQFDHIGKFKGQIVGVKGRRLWWCEPNLPESCPEINVIYDFEMEERDELIGTMQIGNTMWVGMTNAVLFLDELPIVVDGQLISPPKRILSGFPGCPASYGFTTYEENGVPRGAWVSRHGIYGTDGFRGRLLTEDLDWAALVSEANLDSAVLHWDQRESVLTFAYASGSDGNDRYLRLHMDRSHLKNSLPKITGPHYGKIQCMTSGETSGTFRVWSGHVDDGNVYLEDSGRFDKSKAYDDSSDEIRLDVTGPRLFTPNRDLYSLNVGSLRHTEATGETVAVTVTTGRDDGQTEQSVEKTVSLNGHKGTEFFIGRAGEWSEIRIVGAVRETWALQEMNIKARKMGQAGTVLT